MSLAQKGLLILLTAPSGTGKGAVRKELFSRRTDIDYSVSWITRAPRPEDIEGVTYFFKSEEEFEELARNDGFLEHAGLYGKRYGTPKDFVRQQVEKGRHVLLEIDTQGAKQVLEKIQSGQLPYEAVTVFLLPPTMAELKRRLIGRGTESTQKINERFTFAYQELDQAKHFQYCIVNDDIMAAADKIEAVLTARSCAAKYSQHHIDRLKEETVL